ncbi:DMT family transporter [Halodesulfovibrio marinisediminis]|uniref:Threonine/homoserine efflux transporter RhtA n=1 Tax=Halodesulfovibrio marinisediminis DSM 17456 TaxID=1121457 RepID=A0A1N6FV48_9BACT|nr:DMT family transporter [Halodesulfovibrio marinisediminis]SIN99155.1 Threonine/homoserine efflux transporter RhtA [Halodesulfovibrio marinisediminis DSM 17456]
MVVFVKLILTAFLWGGTFVAGRLLSDGMGAFSAAFLRFLLASLCLIWIMYSRAGGLPVLDKKGWIGVWLLGATGVFAYNAFFFTGLQTVPAGRAAVIVSTNPIFITLLAALFFGEKLSSRKGLGICLSVTGATIAISRGDPVSLFTGGLSGGDFAIFGGVASWIAYSLLGKRMMGFLTPYAAITYSCITGTIMLLPFAIYEGMISDFSSYTVNHFLCIAYLGVLGTVIGFTWFYEAINTIGASRSAVFINFVPVAAILSGWFFLGEPLSLSLLAGVSLVVAGVYLTNSAAKRNA